jgi:hypothetical protein
VFGMVALLARALNGHRTLWCIVVQGQVILDPTASR